MKVIISPAKKMKSDDSYKIKNLPLYIDRAQTVLTKLKGLDYKALKALWQCSEQIATKQYELLKMTELTTGLTPAIAAYEGIQYQHIGPTVLDKESMDHLEDTLYILSGMYGILRPRDGIVSYRLEMQAKLKVGSTKNLYEYWGDSLYKALYKDRKMVLNLASKEYDQVIRPYLKEEDIFVDCFFLVRSKEGKLITKATYAKMARGEMVRYIAERRVKNIHELEGFSALGFSYDMALSDAKKIVFVKTE